MSKLGNLKKHLRCGERSRTPVQALKWGAVSLLLTAGTGALNAGAPGPSREMTLNGRKLEIFQQESLPEWGYQKPQKDFFAVLSPTVPRRGAPLYVVLHSAGHDIFSCLQCTRQKGNHDIYHAPDDFYALYPDCRWNIGTDWWWGGLHLKDPGLMKRNAGPGLTPTEKRVVATVRWAVENYGIDPERVYLCGNSMGGSGTLGIGLRHGDLFAAVKANVPAGIEHVSNRMYFPPSRIPAGVRLPDPPVVIDYSAPNDQWSEGHDRFVAAMRDRKYPLIFYWGAFGHGNNHWAIKQKNDLIESFDWLKIRLHEAYPVFTNADSDDPIPWPDDLKREKPGQINAFTVWKNLTDTPAKFSMELRVATAEELGTRQFKVPAKVTAEVAFRRIQKFQVKPGDAVRWSFGSRSGTAVVGPDGLISLPKLEISTVPRAVTLEK